MQACKNTYDKETNKVANELNKLGIGKKTKQNITGKKKATLPTRDSFQDVKEKGGWGREGRLRGGKLQWVSLKKKKSTQKHD